MSHLASFFGGTLVSGFILVQAGMFTEALGEAFQAGYKQGRADALRIDPPNADLEHACAALWLYDNQKGKTWTR